MKILNILIKLTMTRIKSNLHKGKKQNKGENNGQD